MAYCAMGCSAIPTNESRLAAAIMRAFAVRRRPVLDQRVDRHREKSGEEIPGTPDVRQRM